MIGKIIEELESRNSLKIVDNSSIALSLREAIDLVKQVAEENNNGCEYCNGTNQTIYSTYCDVWGILHTDGEFSIQTEHNDSDTMSFKFCPMCGRKL